MVEISFVIVNYNSLDYIRNLLESFRLMDKKDASSIGSIKKPGIRPAGSNATQPEKIDAYSLNNAAEPSAGSNGYLSYEIIIFDNGSSDGSTKYIENEASLRNNIRLLKSSSNEGFCRASNLAAKQAQGKYLVFLNPDTIILESSAVILVNFFENKKNLGEKAGVIGVKTINADGSLQYSPRAFPTIARQFFESIFLFKLFRRSRIFGSYFMTWWDHKTAMEVDWLAGSFMFMKKEVFDYINGFDEDYFMYSEDTDICLRLKRKGYRNYYFPGYKIMHLDSAIASRDQRSRELGIWKSRRLYFRKNYSGLSALFVSCLYFWGEINRMLAYFIFFIFSFNKSAGKKSKMYFDVIKSYFKMKGSHN
jgi:GT2 family glycosyltransferase